MYVVNRKLDRIFYSFEDALQCAVEQFLSNYACSTEWIVKQTKKGWVVKQKNPLKKHNVAYHGMQFIQEI